MKPKILKAHYDILPQAQYNVLSELRKMPSEFVLYGGTAIALHMGHRSEVFLDKIEPSPLEHWSLA